MKNVTFNNKTSVEVLGLVPSLIKKIKHKSESWDEQAVRIICCRTIIMS